MLNNERYLAFLQPFLKRFSRCPICGASFFFLPLVYICVPFALCTTAGPDDALGFVPLPGMVGYGATVWDPLPAYPPRIMEHGAPGPPESWNMHIFTMVAP